MTNIVPMNYDDRSFPFTSDCWFNATVAAKHHHKRPLDWLRLESAKEYAEELGKELGIHALNSKGEISHLLSRVENSF